MERVFTSEVLDSLRPALTDMISQETVPFNFIFSLEFVLT